MFHPLTVAPSRSAQTSGDPSIDVWGAAASRESGSERGLYQDVAFLESANRLMGREVAPQRVGAEWHVGRGRQQACLRGLPARSREELGKELGCGPAGRAGVVRSLGRCGLDGCVVCPHDAIVVAGILTHGSVHPDPEPSGDENPQKGDRPAPAPDATLPLGDVLSYVSQVGVDIEGGSGGQALANQGVDTVHWVLLGVLSTDSAATRFPRALWRAFLTAPSLIPSASPIALTDWSR
jgi:hypothetical protein